MGLWNQLESEAEQQRRAAAQAASEYRQRARVWCDRLLPAMRSLDVYLHRLVVELSRIRPSARLVATLPGYGEVAAYLDHQYQLRVRPTDEAYAILLDYAADIASDECPLVLAEGTAAVTAVADALWKQRLFGVLDAVKNPAGEATAARFQARGRMLLGMRIEADLASGCARLTMNNLEGFGQTRRWLSPEQLTPDMFEALGRFIARRDATLAIGDASLPRGARVALFEPLPRCEWQQPAQAGGSATTR
jgi:hypothetical protein